MRADYPPSAFHAAGDALSKIPHYRSIARDLEAITEDNRKVANWQALREALEPFAYAQSGANGACIFGRAVSNPAATQFFASAGWRIR